MSCRDNAHFQVPISNAMQSRVRGAVEAVAIKNLQELLRKRGITAEALFTKYDFDGDGSIDQSEFKASLESITGQQAPEAILSAIFGAVDTNNDGTLNLEEILALLDGGPSEAVSEGSSVEIRDHPNDQYDGVYVSQPDKINGKTWYMNPTGARLYFYNANSGGAPSWSLDDREQDGSNDWYRGGWARPKSDKSLPTGVRRWVGVGKISVTPVTTLASYSEPTPEETQEEPSEKQRDSIEILDASLGQPVRFRINDVPSSNDAWVGIFPAGAGDHEHGDQHQRWHWLRDIDVNNASFPAQSAGQWSIRVFSDGGFTLHHSEDFEIEDGGSNEFDNFSESMLSEVAAFERDVLEGRITVEEARATADAEAKTQIDNLPFFLRSPAQSLWKANADRMQAEVTARLAERSATIAAGAAVAGTVAGVAAASSMAQDSPEEEVPAATESPTETESEYYSHDDWHEEHHVDVPDRVEVETEVEIPDQVEVDTEVEIPEYEDPDDWYRTTKVNAGPRVSVPDRVTVASRRSSSFTTPTSVANPAASEPTPSQQTADSSSDFSSMSAIAAAFTEARMLSDQRKLSDSVEGKTFKFEIKVTSDAERTFGIGIDDAYRGGMTLIGEVQEVGEVEVRLPSGADSGSLPKGRNSTISASISGWNGIRKRLIVNAQ